MDEIRRVAKEVRAEVSRTIPLSERPDKSGEGITPAMPLGSKKGPSERTGLWQGNRWLIRADETGQETMIRIATSADIARVAANEGRP